MSVRGRRIAAALGVVLVLLAVAWGAVQLRATTQSKPWVHAAPLAMPRDDFGLVAVDGKLWAIGGMTGNRGDALGSVEVYDPAQDRWIDGPAMPTPRASAGVAVLGRTIYVAGGLALGFAVTNVVESLDTETATWTRRATLPTARMQLAAVMVEGKLWAIGGNDASGSPLGVVEIYDPVSDRWAASAPLPTPRYGLAATVFDGSVYTVGGQTARGPEPTVEIATASEARWHAGPPLPEGMTRLGLTTTNGKLHALAGTNHFALSSGEAAWSRARAMFTSRHGLAAATLDGRIYAVGGCSDELVDLGTNEVYQP